MPVPVSVTGWTSKPGAASNENQETMASAGKHKQYVEPPPAAKPAPPLPRPSGADFADVPAEATDSDVGAPVCVRGLNFTYPDLDGSPMVGVEPLIKDMHLVLQPGSRTLLIGPNGAGKSTLLRILAGKHMIAQEAVTVLGRPVFHDTALTSSGQLTYIGGNWQRDVAFAGYAVPMTGDFPASKMLDSIPGVDPKRKARIIEVLDIDVTWRMHVVSDGQRRRVQLAYGLMNEFKVLLLDEITVDLDVLGRADLMQFLKEECETRNCTVLYVTHIFDGLEEWATQIAYVAKGQLLVNKSAKEFPELEEDGSGLLELVARWLRQDKKEKDEREEREGRPMAKRVELMRNNGWASGRLGSSLAQGAEVTQIKNSSNAVLRC